MRRTLGLVAATAVALLSAFVLGEYVLTLWTALAAGAVVGFLLAEIVLSLSAWRGLVPAAVVAALGAAAIAWAGWIESGRGVAPVRHTVWVGVAVAALVGAGRLRPSR